MLDMILDPGLAGRSFGGWPLMNFEWRDVRGKQRLIGTPNKPMRRLHQAFGTYLRSLVLATDSGGYGMRVLPSATACKKGTNHLINAERHRFGRYFYVTDLTDAYGSVSLERLALLITYLVQFEDWVDLVSLTRFGEDDRRDDLQRDPCFQPVLSFLEAHFSGHLGAGLAIGGPLSPYLMNLYSEVYLDAPLRRLIEKRGGDQYQITYTRYVDDLVFSCRTFIGPRTRRRIREIIAASGFQPNHRKSRVGILGMGPVSVTQIGLEQPKMRERPLTPGDEGEVVGPNRLVFPQKKRRRLHGLIHGYLSSAMDWPEKVSGYMAEFLYYYKRVAVKTATDQKTFALCQAFKAEWDRYGGPKWQRRRHRVS